jgi:hypothetical protein
MLELPLDRTWAEKSLCRLPCPIGADETVGRGKRLFWGIFAAVGSSLIVTRRGRMGLKQIKKQKRGNGGINGRSRDRH